MIYRFGDCEVDAARFELRRQGATLPVEPQVLEVLLYLIERRDRAVTRQELFNNLWRGRIVTDSALNSRIKAARAAIGDDGETQARIRTLHRTGYRFVGVVEELSITPVAGTAPGVEGGNAAETPEQTSPPVAIPRARNRSLIGTALSLVLAASMFSLLPRDTLHLGRSAAVASSPAPAPTTTHKSLAVLPFANLSDDPEQEYFADGISVELMKVLSHLPDLVVTGRTSAAYFEGSKESSLAIGRRLGVAHLLTGSVRKSGEQVRIAVELIEAASGYQLWADSYERDLEDIFDVQDEIAARVATALKVKLGLGESGEIGMTRNVAAYDEFLRGYAAYNEHTPQAFPLAIEHMHRAIALDPEFSRAWAYLYCIYIDGSGLVPQRAEEWLRKSVEALERAHDVTPDSPFVAILRVREDMRKGKQFEARAALDALPAGYWTADRFVTRDVFLGRFLIATGHAKEAVEALERARATDPLSPVVALYLSLAHAMAGDVAQALALSDDGIELRSLKPVIVGNAILVALGTGDPEEIRRRVGAAGETPANREINETLLARLDDPGAGRVAVRHIAAAASSPDFIRSVLIVHWAAYFGDAELALEELGAIAHGAVDEALLWRPVLANVRKLPGFKELVAREGLVDYWRANGWPDACAPTVGDDFECR